jgi:hypothetical protein
MSWECSTNNQSHVRFPRLRPTPPAIKGDLSIFDATHTLAGPYCSDLLDARIEKFLQEKAQEV